MLVSWWSAVKSFSSGGNLRVIPRLFVVQHKQLSQLFGRCTKYFVLDLSGYAGHNTGVLRCIFPYLLFLSIFVYTGVLISS
jgi:hypothetical protein